MRTVLFSLLLTALLASGCAVRGPAGSWCGPLPEGGAVSAIATDAVSALTELYPPGHTTLYLVPAKDAGNGFAGAFENSLRAQGFTLAAVDSPDAIAGAYTLDALDEKTAWYLQLRLSDGKSIARAYTASGQPEAGQSRTSIEFRRSTLGKMVDKADKTARQAWDSGTSALTE